MLTDLVALDGGRYLGWDRRSSIPKRRRCTPVTVAPFAIERHPVTNAQFAEFVDDTGYRTVAEIPPDPALYPGAAPADLVPGALVFRPTGGPVDLRDWRQWWEWMPGADWRHPRGPNSSIDDKADHPVVQVCLRRRGWPTPGGRAAGCRPRRNGSSPPAAVRTPSIRGATTPPRTAR